MLTTALFLVVVRWWLGIAVVRFIYLAYVLCLMSYLPTMYVWLQLSPRY